MLSVKGDSRAQGLLLPQRKYYFHVATEFTVHTDDSGVMLNDLAAAHRYAVSAIWNYIRFDIEEQDWKGWHVKSCRRNRPNLGYRSFSDRLGERSSI